MVQEDGELAQLVPSPDPEVYAGEDDDPEDEGEPEVENLSEPLGP